MSHITRILSASFVLALAACSGGTGPYGSSGSQSQQPGPGPLPANTVAATPNLVFTPNPLTIASGGSVTFAFGAVGHNVTFDAPGAGTPADIPGVNSGVSIQRTFAAPGTYRFHCTIHPGMAGSIVVQ